MGKTLRLKLASPTSVKVGYQEREKKATIEEENRTNLKKKNIVAKTKDDKKTKSSISNQRILF